MRCGVWLLVIASAASAQTLPDPAGQTKMIGAIREAALAYVKNLPDYICTQTTRRELFHTPNALAGVRTNARGTAGIGNNNTSQWQLLDIIEEQLTYFGHRESYRLLKVNGKAPKARQHVQPGMTSSGEFGSTLEGIFDPESRAEFEWKRWDVLRGRPVAVFSFRVQQASSTAMLEAPSRRIVVGYHGLIFADQENETVLRLNTEAEIPADFPMQNVTHQLDYGVVEVAGQEHLLPLHGEMESRMSRDFMEYGREGGNSPQVTLRNTVDFRDYRKYSTESELKLDPKK